jgi:hypothetical protein
LDFFQLIPRLRRWVAGVGRLELAGREWLEWSRRELKWLEWAAKQASGSEVKSRVDRTVRLN